jgi:chemotaxis signal transduction protein
VSRALLPLRLDEAWVAIDALAAREVLGRRQLVAIPGASAALPGVIAWNGRAIAVVDLGALAGLGRPLSAAVERERTVVVQVGASTFALPVDAVREVAAVPDDELRALHATAQRFATHEVTLNGAPLPVLDLAAMALALGQGGDTREG